MRKHFLVALAFAGAAACGDGNGGGGQQQTVATPVFAPAGGTYGAPQSVTITTATPGATIRYTSDGSPPTASSTVYSTPIGVSTATNLRAIATLSGYADSAVASASYDFQAATPTFLPPGGSYASAQAVTIASTTPGAVIYYTTDGSPPTTASTLYTGPVDVSATTTLRAIATAAGYAGSAAGAAAYTIGTACDPPAYDMTGTWRLGWTNQSNTCGDPTGTTAFADVQITQSGNDLAVVGFGTGTLCGSAIRLDFQYTEASGTVNETLEATMSSANSFAGTSTWSWTLGAFSCGGTEAIAGTRQ